MKLLASKSVTPMNTITPQSSQQSITDDQWHAIKVNLPENANEAQVRSELERIARDQSPPRDRAKECYRQARLCDDFKRALPTLELISNREALTQDLDEQSEALTRRAKFYEHMADQGKTAAFLRRCDILFLWQTQSGEDPAISETSKVIDFYRAATIAMVGQAPDNDRIKNIIGEYIHFWNPSAAKFGGENSLAANADVLKASAAKLGGESLLAANADEVNARQA